MPVLSILSHVTTLCFNARFQKRQDHVTMKKHKVHRP